MKTKKYCYDVPDYSHRGDLSGGESYIRRICPQATDISSYEERDSEAEWDYENEYGELDEHIYRGFVTFKAPISCEELLREHNIY